MIRKIIQIMICLAIFSSSPLSTEAAAYYSFSMTSPISSHNLFYSDENIAIAFPIEPTEIKRIPFYLYNKTSGPVKIDWNQLSFIGLDNSSVKTYHTGVLYADANNNKPMSPSIIPPKSKISDFIGLSSGLSFAGEYTGWQENFIFPNSVQDAEPYKNKSFSIFMPIEINSKINYYTFTFSINKITKEWESQPYLGVGGYDKEMSIFYESNVKNDKGVFILTIYPNSPAEKAGLHVGDIMTKFNNANINTFSDFLAAINDCKPGSKVKVTVLRNNHPLDILITLGEKPQP